MYLWVLVPKTVALNIEGIASCQTQITYQFPQHLFYRPREKLQNLWSVTILVHVHNLQIRVTAVYGSLKALQHVSVNVVFIEFRIFKTSLMRSIIAVAVRACLTAYAFTMCSLPVMTSAASLSRAGKSPPCSN